MKKHQIDNYTMFSQVKDTEMKKTVYMALGASALLLTEVAVNNLLLPAIGA